MPPLRVAPAAAPACQGLAAGQELAEGAQPGGAPAGVARTVVALTAMALLGGCARTVAVDPPADLDPAAAQACAQLATGLPEELSTVGPRRSVTPDSLLTAAWGDPPVSLRCGVPVPAALGPMSTLVTVDGIDWLPEQLTGGYLMTTAGRVANVEITVPAAVGPAPAVAADLGPAIKAALPVAPE